MKNIKWIVFVLLILLTLLTAIITPIAWIGIFILIFGIYQKIQKDKGKVTFAKPWIIILAGFFISWISALALVEPSEEITKETTETQKEEKIIKKTDENANESIEEVTQVPETITSEDKSSEKNEAPQVEAAIEENHNTTNTNTNTSNSENSSSPSTINSNTEVSTSSYEYYKNCTELRAVYPSGVGQDHPAYASKHDRDKDGWACEQ